MTNIDGTIQIIATIIVVIFVIINAFIIFSKSPEVGRMEEEKETHSSCSCLDCGNLSYFCGKEYLKIKQLKAHKNEKKRLEKLLEKYKKEVEKLEKQQKI